MERTKEEHLAAAKKLREQAAASSSPTEQARLEARARMLDVLAQKIVSVPGAKYGTRIAPVSQLSSDRKNAGTTARAPRKSMPSRSKG